MRIGVIASLTVREAARRRILLAAVLVGIVYLALYGIGLHLQLGDTAFRPRELSNPLIRRFALNFFLSMGLFAVNWLVVAVTILTSVDTIAGEINSGTIQSVVTKPIRRWEVLLGKWLGFAAMITVFLLLLAGGVILEMVLVGGHRPPNVAATLALMWLESMLLLAVTFRVGTSLSALATGVCVFGVHGLAFLGGWIEEFGQFAHSETATTIGVLVSIVMPSDTLWHKAVSMVQGPLMGGVGRTPFSFASVPNGWMVAYACLYLMVALALAVRRFSQRDL